MNGGEGVVAKACRGATLSLACRGAHGKIGFETCSHLAILLSGSIRLALASIAVESRLVKATLSSICRTTL